MLLTCTGMKRLQPEYKFLLRACLYFIALYGCCYLIIGLAAPGGLYLSWVRDHFNVIDQFRNMILRVCSFVMHTAGTNNYISGNILKVINGARIRLNNGCLGLAVISLWWAVIMAYPTATKQKAKYLLAGSVAIIIINCARVITLAYVYSSPLAREYRNIDHHLIANIITWSIFLYLMRLWFRNAAIIQKSDPAS